MRCTTGSCTRTGGTCGSATARPRTATPRPASVGGWAPSRTSPLASRQSRPGPCRRSNTRPCWRTFPAVVYETDPDDERRTVYMNRKIEDLLGYSMEEWLDQPDMWIEVLHPDDRERELAAHDLASTTGDPWAREYRMIGAEGQVVWLRDQAVLSARRRRERHPLAGRDDGHHRREGGAARACRRPRRARVPRARTHRGAAGDERIDGHRDRRAPARRGRASARGTAARSHPRQRAGRRLPLADARGRRRDVLVVHHAEDRRDARLQPDGVGGRWLAHPAASAR